MLTLRGVDFGSVFNAPGARGFFTEPYIHHALWQWLGLNWEGTTFVAKTATLEAHDGNMPLKDDRITPKEIVPRCIYLNAGMFFSGYVLNAVELSGPGARFLLDQQVWQNWPKPLVISFMAVAPTKWLRIEETRRFFQILKSQIRPFASPIALHINFGCPNVNIDRQAFKDEIEIKQTLNILSGLNIPLLANFGPTTGHDILLSTAKLDTCDGLWLANTFPFDQLPEDVRMMLFGSLVSPLTRRGFSSPGGLSGPYCLPYVIRQIRGLRSIGVTKPIIAGNGIQSTKAVEMVHAAGADAIALGIIGLLRPWRMRQVIDKTNQLFG